MKRGIETVTYRPSSDRGVAQAAMRLAGGDRQMAAWMTGSSIANIEALTERSKGTR